MAKKKKKTARRAAKKTARRPATRRTAKKKSARRTTKKAAARKPASIGGAKGKARTKSEIYGILADHNGISKREVAGVFDTLGALIAADLKKGNAGVVNVGGLMKVIVQRKPATKSRKGTNPFTGEPCIFKAKPARNVVKVRPLKALKDKV